MGLFALRKEGPSSISLSHGEASNPSDRSVTEFIRARFNGRRKRQANLTQLFNHTADPTSIDSSLKIVEQKYASPPVGSGAVQAPRRSDHLLSHRTSSDIVTVTLAHKLNELATAHKEGLLNDDDYRVLRQNLFDSFATHSTPPVEAPVVKSVEPVSLRYSSTSPDDCSTTNSVRAPSLQTQNTNRSSVSTLFRRLRSRSSRDHSMSEQDRTSISSSTPRFPLSPALNSDTRELGRQASTTSVKITHSRQIPPDLRSVSSKKSLQSTMTTSDVGGISRGSTRSFRTNPPPSSFNAKYVSSRLSSLDSNVDRLRSAADIRAAIRSMEAEQQSVIASLSLLSQHQFSSAPYGHTQYLNSRMGISAPLVSSNDSRNGYEWSASDSYSAHIGAVPDEKFWMNYGNDEDIQLNELGRRRAEITMRYQQRLDYLKARLKGAEIHERLLRK
ncbi:hypothetical protein ACEPAF_9625 [Sanghuangporus sanghuang]